MGLMTSSFDPVTREDLRLIRQMEKAGLKQALILVESSPDQIHFASSDERMRLLKTAVEAEDFQIRLDIKKSKQSERLRAIDQLRSQSPLDIHWYLQESALGESQQTIKDHGDIKRFVSPSPNSWGLNLSGLTNVQALETPSLTGTAVEARSLLSRGLIPDRIVPRAALDLIIETGLYQPPKGVVNLDTKITLFDEIWALTGHKTKEPYQEIPGYNPSLTPMAFAELAIRLKIQASPSSQAQFRSTPFRQRLHARVEAFYQQDAQTRPKANLLIGLFDTMPPLPTTELQRSIEESDKETPLVIVIKEAPQFTSVPFEHRQRRLENYLQQHHPKSPILIVSDQGLYDKTRIQSWVSFLFDFKLQSTRESDARVPRGDYGGNVALISAYSDLNSELSQLQKKLAENETHIEALWDQFSAFHRDTRHLQSQLQRADVNSPFVKTWIADHQQLQYELDAYHSNTFDYVALYLAKSFLSLPRADASPKFLLLREQLYDNVLSYFSSKRHYSRRGDELRVDSIRAMLRLSDELLDELEPEETTTRRRIGWSQAGPWLKKIGADLQKIGPRLRFLKDLVFTDHKKHPATIFKSLSRLFRRISIEQDIYVEVDSALGDYLNSRPADQLDLLTPNHKNAQLDMAALAHLQQDESIVVAYYTNDPYRQWFHNQTLGSRIVTVGKRGQDPFKYIYNNIDSGARSLIVYPEGHYPGMSETRAPRPEFSSMLVHKVSDHYPVTGLVPLTFVADHTSPADETRIHVRMGQPLSPKALEHLRQLGGDQAVGVYIRANWLEAFGLTSTHIFGMPRFSKTQNRLDGYNLNRCFKTFR